MLTATSGLDRPSPDGYELERSSSIFLLLETQSMPSNSVIAHMQGSWKVVKSLVQRRPTLLWYGKWQPKVRKLPALPAVRESLLYLQQNGTSMSLNFDIIHAIMARLDRGDLLRMMHTCRTLYNLGIPLLLRDVSFVDDLHVPNFSGLYQHFLADPERFNLVVRAACYHNSGPYQWLDDKPMPRAFPRLITLGKNLRHLTICFDVAATVKDKEIAQIASLSRLRSLKLQGQFPVTRILRALTVPLEEVTVEQMTSTMDHMPDSEEAGASDLIPTLSKFRTSLKSLSISLYSAQVAFLPGYCFPYVQQLNLQLIHLADVNVLPSLFPGTTELRIKIPRPDFRFYTPGEESLQDPKPLSAESPWSMTHSLHTLSGDPMTIWFLGLHRCRATNLKVDWVQLPSELSSRLQSIRNGVQPYRLTISAPLRDIQARYLVHDSVRELELQIDFRESALASTAAVLVCLLVV